MTIDDAFRDLRVLDEATARKELAERRQKNPHMIHQVRMKNEELVVSSVDIQDYVQDIRRKYTKRVNFGDLAYTIKR